ncbi:LysR substrate-binding domain-containing protein [Cognatazoarcus halotolerans]|uniref:LysR substrate-binding domain-containing protein n=1 Tax=Cognatazoarcus halotolerans TaxID=2686016 RepID=UPI0013567833|nr:LysR substrate-binding domain-containing protein [Cognatazoarcus halotolerans]MCB1900887.1 LysR family transcriptional regulator [Rhodocyclaceae bacterium]MCP5308668.1 LysR family transcriptional regulator [Zoogloeaceae bacterium]
MKLASRVTLRQLRALDAVATSGSFTDAARLLHLTQPAVSMQLRELEGIVGEVLLDGRREIRLTHAGEVLVRRAREVFDSLELAEVEIKARRGVAAGTLEVVAITTAEYFVPHLLAEFGRRFPEISFRLSVENRERVHALLREQRVDVAIMGTPPKGIPLRRTPFAPHALSFVARPDHHLAGKRALPPASLTEERLLLRERGSGTRDHLERYLKHHGVRPERADELGSNETLKQAAMAGLGVAFLSHHTFAMEAETGRLVRLDVQDTPVIREWNVVVRSDRPPTPAVEALLEFLQTEGATLLRAHTA